MHCVTAIDRTADWAADYGRTVSRGVPPQSRANAPGVVRTRVGAEPYGDGGPPQHRPGALGANGGGHRPAPAEGQLPEGSERHIMTRRVSCWILATLFPAVAAAQTVAAPVAERLSLDAALKLAVESNRQLQAARLEVEKAGQDIAIARLRRLPTFETEVASSQLLTPAGFSFPRGAFGEFPSTGPIPAADTTVTVPQQPTLYVMSQVSQPLTQLKRIGLGIKSAEATVAIEKERTRGQQLALVTDVKRLYFGILQTESALNATAQAIELYRELDRTLQVRVVQRVALRSDALDVQYRLAHEELTLTSR